MLRTLIALLALLLFAHPSCAGDYGFETTSDGITDALTRPATAQPGRTRSWTRSPASETRTLKIVKMDQSKTVEETVLVSNGQPPQSVNLKIEFDTNSYAIRPESFRVMRQLGKALTSDRLKGKIFALKGHTDADGSDAYNLQLSLNRALAVQNYLIGNFSISPERLQVFGYGESMPLVANATARNKQLNRRVEVQALP